MRAVFVAVLVALVLASAASAKLHVSLVVSESRVRAHEHVAVVIRTGEPTGADCTMRLIAVAPGIGLSTAVRGFVGGTVDVPLRRLGFEPTVVRTSPKSWRTRIRFPRPGRWRLVVPNECAPGWMSPWPALRSVLVR